ncbi:hypothetical protein ACFQYP_17640 [Nonomuraea antimicrobica]|uniref:hypothetical protein n=1 Tax=Nonomuraea antimicrobica TaxID=561173 RepID=UPI0031F0A67D
MAEKDHPLGMRQGEVDDPAKPGQETVQATFLSRFRLGPHSGEDHLLRVDEGRFDRGEVFVERLAAHAV